MVLTSMAPPRPSAAGVVSSIRLVRSREGIPSMKLEDGTGEQGFAHERGGRTDARQQRRQRRILTRLMSRWEGACSESTALRR